MTHRQAITLGLLTGATFSLGALIADLIYRSRLPHIDILTDPTMFLEHITRWKAHP